MWQVESNRVYLKVSCHYERCKLFRTLNGSQLAEMKKYIPCIQCHKIDSVEAVGLKIPLIYFEGYSFLRICEIGAIS